MNKDFFINNKEILIKIGIAVGLVIIALVSMFVLAGIFGGEEFHQKSIEHLNKKEGQVIGLTATTAGAATILAAAPGDATTPIANQLMDMSGYLLIVLGVIFLEKILLTLTGKLTFLILIPAACVLTATYIFTKREKLKVLAFKIAAFGLIIFTIVPVSVQLSMFIEDTYGVKISQTIEQAENVKNSKVEEKEDVKEDPNLWDKITGTVSNVVSSVGDSVDKLLEKGKTLLSNFMNALAILLITSCVIPMGVLFIMLWVVKLIFGVTVSVNDIKPKMPHFKGKAKKEEKVEETV